MPYIYHISNEILVNIIIYLFISHHCRNRDSNEWIWLRHIKKKIQWKPNSFLFLHWIFRKDFLVLRTSTCTPAIDDHNISEFSKLWLKILFDESIEMFTIKFAVHFEMILRRVLFHSATVTQLIYINVLIKCAIKKLAWIKQRQQKNINVDGQFPTTKKLKRREQQKWNKAKWRNRRIECERNRVRTELNWIDLNEYIWTLLRMPIDRSFQILWNFFVPYDSVLSFIFIFLFVCIFWFPLLLSSALR